jgi:hypothetical protein
MKFKTTRKDLKTQFGKAIYYVHMNSPERLLGEPDAYLTRVEGWACDVWIFGSICITEGYAPIGKAIDFDICREYEEKARHILGNKWTWKRQQAQIEKLREKFIEYVKGC